MIPPYIDFHTHIDYSRADVVVLYSYEAPAIGGASVGIHPWFAAEDELLSLQSNVDSVMFIGECGLDKCCNVDWQTQMTLFVSHIELSERLKKPLVIHCVRAYNELAQISRRFYRHQPWIVHGYNQSVEWLNQNHDQNIYASFGAAILHSGKAQRAVARCGSNRILFETDNNPNVDIVDIYKMAAKHRGITENELRELVWNNYQSIVG